jgi:isoquinoline 1-oxidoreductase beta subunit
VLVGGGVGVGLALAWGAVAAQLRAEPARRPGRDLFNAFLKIGRDGRVIVAVPQAELGQGVYTSLPQILADELGADWRTVSVEPAPISPLYANQLLAGGGGGGGCPPLPGHRPLGGARICDAHALMLTGGSTSIRAFEARMREAGAAARALLSMAAAERWNADWETLDTAAASSSTGRADRFAELAEAAAGFRTCRSRCRCAAGSRTG